MSLVGIFTESKNENYLKKGLKNVFQQEQVFFLKEESIENLKNITFQTILIGKSISKNEQILRDLMKKAQYLIFNADILDNLYLLKDLSIQLITYGFNSKSTITTSSVEENKIMICLQRTIKNLQGKTIEPQEIKKEIFKNEDSYAVMELISLLLLYR